MMVYKAKDEIVIVTVEEDDDFLVVDIDAVIAAEDVKDYASEEN